ncbi:MAG: hypothetical protein ABJA02_06320 [Acidobacteriota bacterium]
MKIHNTHTSTTKRLLDNAPRPVLRLGEIARLIRAHRIIVPPLSRPKLIDMCASGIFETVGDRPTSMGWLVYEDSFLKWVDSLRAP